MICYMKVLSTLLCLLLLHQNASASCPPGQMFNHNKKSCEPCPPKLFSASENRYCDNCIECKKGSREVKKCTTTSDAVCRCKEGFTPIDEQKQEICFCKKGFGINQRGICTECTAGFFTDKDDTSCKIWRECKSGIKFQGNSTADVVCKDASIEETETPKTPTTPIQTTTISSTSTSRTTVSSSNKKKDFSSLWLVMACVVVILLAGLLYHKCKVTHCIHNHKKVDFRKESVCRKPVEESGEKCLSLLV
ncbi:tumor necrosis factor receptor superfamily member 9 isoform X2 [Onychostoma macrolepis]|uniref:TNFR-Cys domain-containing protein n=1 Tax=Onychostoma macrolepis TaxID=369639 RepID=A0A7J6CZU0_9TELE|nr:tumor necrosis factor receptor superfamily member 9 isoform X2 [Onychostoma macrolepis]KAF4112452.1 hypothetical protein G5714_007247 [Onychostoma macrolepis]